VSAQAVGLYKFKAAETQQKSEDRCEKYLIDAKFEADRMAREADRMARERRKIEVDYAAMPVLTEENTTLRAQIVEGHAREKEKDHKLMWPVAKVVIALSTSTRSERT
jgi:hypothetical protein